MDCSRRGFLQAGISSLSYFTLAPTVPLWISKAAAAVSTCVPEDRILVIFQMAGGNDGLNTVIPYTDPKYLETGAGALRPNLHIVSGLGATELGDGLNALHPKLVRLKNWYSAGRMAVLQNIGYPNPNLSHFRGTDLWELGISPGSQIQPHEGWLARFYDNQCGGMPPDQINALSMLAAATPRLPLTLSNGANYAPPAVHSFAEYQIRTPLPASYGAHIRDYIEVMNSQNVPGDSALDFIQRAANVAQASVDDIAIASQTPLLRTYPLGSRTLGPGLEMASRIIRTEAPHFETKVFYVTQGGYDTHANQFDGVDPVNNGLHPQLLDEMDQCLDTFLQDMEDSGNLDRVLLLTFSEFGRRPQENGSFGTDHGTANCLFALGGPVVGGVYGGQPDLQDLLAGNQGGNLKHKVDFRSVFSVVLRDWLGADPADVFGADFDSSAFTIASGMSDVEFLNTAPAATSVPAFSGEGLAAAAGLTALAGALYLRSRGKEPDFVGSVATATLSPAKDFATDMEPAE